MLGIGREGPRMEPSAPFPPGPGTQDVAFETDPGGGDEASANEERRAHAVLAAVAGLGPVTLGDLLRRVGPPRRVVELAERDSGKPLAEALAASTDLADDRARTIGRELVERIVEAVAQRSVLLRRVDELGLGLVTVDDPLYPPRLRAIEMPPPVLYVRGDRGALDRPHVVAVVGTRRPSERGRRTASRIAGALARVDATVVSGLAFGIDGAAHAAAIAEAGPTVAVLGGGHGRIYPRAHERLATRIAAEGGAVISELPPDIEANRGTFPRRNRLISGLADATVVVEAAARSGALITAGWALEQGRGCFLVPGSLDDPMSAGCLAFLREWSGEARLVAGIDELLEDLGLGGAPVVAPGASPVDGASPTAPDADAGSLAGARVPSVLGGLGPAERTVALALIEGCATTDDIVARTGLPVAAVLGTLTLLEIRGLVAGSYGRYLPVGRLVTARTGQTRASGRAPIGPRAGRFATPSSRVLP